MRRLNRRGYKKRAKNTRRKKSRNQYITVSRGGIRL